jgi:hypothetical protein
VARRKIAQRPLPLILKGQSAHAAVSSTASLFYRTTQTNIKYKKTETEFVNKTRKVCLMHSHLHTPSVQLEAVDSS